jgi:hypothetical protein
MLRSVNEIVGYGLHARDGEIGRCKDFLWDDLKWAVRYMVADTGKWLPGRQVLVSPISLGRAEWASKRLPVHLTRKQIEEAPMLDEDAPVSRQYEIEWNRYHGYLLYWAGEGLWGYTDRPGALFHAADEGAEVEIDDAASGDSHLRSVGEVTGYHIQAQDGEIGHIEDFLVDDEAWALRYVVVDTKNWLPGRKVLISPSWIGGIDWRDTKVTVELTKGAVRNSPKYDPSEPVNLSYEEKLYDYYGRPKYW